MIVYLVPVFIALTLITLAAAIYQIRFRTRQVSDRLKRVVDGTEEADSMVAAELIDTKVPLYLQPLSFLAWLLPGHIYSEVLQWDLAQGGLRHPESRKIFAGAKVFTTFLIGFGTLFATWQLHLASDQVLIFTGLGIVVGYFAPVMWLRWKQSQRRMEITLALPDALDLLVICVEAGQGLNAALLKVGRECRFHSQALSDELKTVNNEMRAGVVRAQALRNFALRTGVEDVRALVGVMIQSDRFGTSIAQALRIHSESLRTRRRQRAEEAARKTPVKMVFPLVFCIFPELLVVILAPGMLQLFRALSDVSKG